MLVELTEVDGHDRLTQVDKPVLVQLLSLLASVDDPMGGSCLDHIDVLCFTMVSEKLSAHLRSNH